MDSTSAGIQLSQLSRLLFDSAANRWYLAIGLEVLAGLIGVLAVIFGARDQTAILILFPSVVLYLVAYGLRLWAEEQHQTAETMRRQSVLAEALGWSVPGSQMDEWKRRAGHNILKSVTNHPRPDDYYTIESSLGEQKLAAMTIESAFYTYHLYRKILLRLQTLFWGVVAVLIVALSVAALIDDETRLQIVHVLYAVVPVILAVDVFGWTIRLKRNADDVQAIWRGIEDLYDRGQFTTEDVLRLVAEYNNTVSHGIPIHNYLFDRWHEEIDTLWSRSALRSKATTAN